MPGEVVKAVPTTMVVSDRVPEPPLISPEFEKKLEEAKSLKGVKGFPSPFEQAVQGMWGDIKAIENILGPSDPKPEEMRRRLNNLIYHG